MKQRLLILLVFLLLIAALAGLNAASYQQKEKTPDSELSPNRSSFNSGPTGTQAWFSLLAETGRKATRWQEPPAALLTSQGENPQVFVLVGSLRREFTDADAEPLLRWVSEGGRLVLIDRAPPEKIATTTANWRITLDEPQLPAIFSADPSDQKVMTAETAAARPSQPTVLTAGVNAIQPSRFAASILIERYAGDTHTTVEEPAGRVAEPSQIAPTVHFPLRDEGLVVDAPFGSGRIIFVSDPYIVSNGGVALADNAQLAINLVRGNGVIAFDEYHQGYGTDNNRFLQFFAGTPVVAIFMQAALLVGLVFFSQSRRFARPVPEPELDRLSKLEYVAAMAELQRRTRAYDLAVENIYSEARRRICRSLGLDTMAARPAEIAALAAERTGRPADTIEATLFKCEEIIRGEPTNKSEVLALVAELRSLEESLGILRASRSPNAH